jgi:hypothetical protein
MSIRRRWRAAPAPPLRSAWLRPARRSDPRRGTLSFRPIDSPSITLPTASAPAASQYLDSCGIFKDAVLSILATIAKQEQIRLSERTIAGLEKARREGRIGGRPAAVVDRERIAQMDEEGFTLREIAEEM